MTEKIASLQELKRKRVYEFYLDHRTQGKKFTIAHFSAENIPSKTIYRIIERAENESGHQRVIGSGRKAKIMTFSTIKKLESMFDHRDGISQR